MGECSAVGTAVCVPANAVYTITVGSGFTSPVTLSVTGNPAGTTVNFSLNPVPATGGVSILTIGNTGAAAPGTYNLIVTGTSGITVVTDAVTLKIQNAAPVAPTLLSPANMAVNQVNHSIRKAAVFNGASGLRSSPATSAFNGFVSSGMQALAHCIVGCVSCARLAPGVCLSETNGV